MRQAAKLGACASRVVLLLLLERQPQASRFRRAATRAAAVQDQ
jgi:hypothetical protein